MITITTYPSVPFKRFMCALIGSTVLLLSVSQHSLGMKNEIKNEMKDGTGSEYQPQERDESQLLEENIGSNTGASIIEASIDSFAIIEPQEQTKKNSLKQRNESDLEERDLKIEKWMLEEKLTELKLKLEDFKESGDDYKESRPLWKLICVEMDEKNLKYDDKSHPSLFTEIDGLLKCIQENIAHFNIVEEFAEEQERLLGDFKALVNLFEGKDQREALADYNYWKTYFKKDGVDDRVFQKPQKEDDLGALVALEKELMQDLKLRHEGLSNSNNLAQDSGEKQALKELLDRIRTEKEAFQKLENTCLKNAGEREIKIRSEREGAQCNFEKKKERHDSIKKELENMRKHGKEIYDEICVKTEKFIKPYHEILKEQSDKEDKAACRLQVARKEMQKKEIQYQKVQKEIQEIQNLLKCLDGVPGFDCTIFDLSIRPRTFFPEGFVHKNAPEPSFFSSINQLKNSPSGSFNPKIETFSNIGSCDRELEAAEKELQTMDERIRLEKERLKKQQDLTREDEGSLLCDEQDDCVLKILEKEREGAVKRVKKLRARLGGDQANQGVIQNKDIRAVNSKKEKTEEEEKMDAEGNLVDPYGNIQKTQRKAGDF